MDWRTNYILKASVPDVQTRPIFLEFSANFKAEKAESIMFALCLKTTLPSFTQWFSIIGEVWDEQSRKYYILVQMFHFIINFMIYVSLQSFVIAIYALFPPIFWDDKSPPLIFHFRIYAYVKQSVESPGGQSSNQGYITE